MPTVDLRQARMQLEDTRDDAKLLEQEDDVSVVEEVTRMRMRKAHHRPECTVHECFCFDPERADPMCSCGHAGWDCHCDELPENQQLEDDPWPHDDPSDDPYDECLEVAGFAHPWDGEEPSP